MVYTIKTRKEQIEELRYTFRMRLIAGVGFFFTGFILWKLKIFTFPIILFSVAPLGEAFLNQPYFFLIRKIKNLHILTLFQLVIDIFLITWGIYFLGGMNIFYAPVVYVLPILFAGYLLSPGVTIWIVTLSILSYAGIIWLEYFRILPFMPVLELKLGLIPSLGILLVEGLALYFIAYFSSLLGRIIRERSQEIAKAKDYIDGIIRSMIDMLIVIDSDGKIKIVNKATSDLLGYEEEELIGKPVGTIFAEAEKIAFFKESGMKKLMEEGSIKDYDMTYKTKLGKKIAVSFSGSVMRKTECPQKGPVKDCPDFKEKGIHCSKIIGIVGIARDVRQIKRLIQREKELTAQAAVAAEFEKKRAAELENAYNKLEETRDILVQMEKLNAVGQLASGIAHEVKNPLGTIIQGVDYLGKKVPPNKDISEVLSIMKDNIRRADNIICALIDFSRVTKLKREPQDINLILENSLLLIQHSFRWENIEVIKEMKEGLPKVLVDRGKMEQVFINIFLNAVQAMPKGGKLFIRSYLTQMSKPGNKVGRRNGDYFGLGEPAVVVEIEDTGSGISKRHLQRIFDPFFTTKGPREGAGLGLAVTRNIITMHKGLIKIESEEDKGTKVIITLKIRG